MDKYLKIAKESGASQDNFELATMLYLVSQINPKNILEIGIHTANGLKAYGQAFPDAMLVGLEIDTAHLQYKNFVLVEGDGTKEEIQKKVESHGPFDFIFIDGDHTYEGAKADWENYKGMCRKGGVVGFHDTSRMGDGWMSKVEVRKLIDEIVASDSYPFVDIRNGNENPGTVLFWV